MAEEGQDEHKIIIDDDWKAQAQAEKEKLAQDLKDTSAPAPAQPAGPADQGAEPAGEAPDPHQVPQASFSILVNSLLTQIFFALGAIANPQDGKRYVDLELAKHHIDMLAVIEDKTKGNLSEDEIKLLDQAMYEARMQYVQTAQALQQ